MRRNKLLLAIACVLLLPAFGSLSYATEPVGVSPPGGKHTYGLYWRDDGSGPYGSMQFYLDGKPLDKPYTLNASSTNMASGIYIFLLLDNDNKGADWKNNPFCVQYVMVWRLNSTSRSNSEKPEKTSHERSAKS